MELNVGAREDEDDLAFDYLFEKLSKDIDEFQKTRGIQDIYDPANHEDFIDTFFSFVDSKDNNANNDPSPSQSESIVNLILQDFERAELAPRASEAEVQWDDATKEETQEMIDELRQETWEFSITNDNNMCSYTSVGGVELFLKNHRLNAAAYGSGDLAFGCSVRYFFCGETNKNAKENNTAMARKRRRYRGVELSEEEAARKREENKIKNRETAAKAHHMKLAREQRMHYRYLKLHHKNEVLKKQIMFLELHERINIPPKPLKRTISALL